MAKPRSTASAAFYVDTSDLNALAARLTGEILARRTAFAKGIAQKTVWPVRVELVDEGRLPRNPRTGKLIRVIDDR